MTERFYLQVIQSRRNLPLRQPHDLPDLAAVYGLVGDLARDIRENPDLYGPFEHWANADFVITSESGHHVASVPFTIALSFLRQ
jgi:hypothetical protein